MTCSQCNIRYATTLSSISGAALCSTCAEARPDKWPEGTHPGSAKNPVVVANENQARLLEVRTAQAARLAALLEAMMITFPELRTSLTTAPQQALLREVRAALAEAGL